MGQAWRLQQASVSASDVPRRLLPPSQAVVSRPVHITPPTHPPPLERWWREDPIPNRSWGAQSANTDESRYAHFINTDIQCLRRITDAYRSETAARQEWRRLTSVNSAIKVDQIAQIAGNATRTAAFVFMIQRPGFHLCQHLQLTNSLYKFMSFRKPQISPLMVYVTKACATSTFRMHY
jgi:hypothetical protein